MCGKFYHLDLQAAEGDCTPREVREEALIPFLAEPEHRSLRAHLQSDTLPPTKPHRFQQDHTYTNKTTHLNSATSCGPTHYSILSFTAQEWSFN